RWRARESVDAAASVLSAFLTFACRRRDMGTGGRASKGLGLVLAAASGVAACDGGEPLDDDGGGLHVSALATDSCPVPAALRDFHLTARPWTALALPRARFLDRAQAVVQSIVQYQDASGAIIDPDKHQEWQYATPFFAEAVATLVD